MDTDDPDTLSQEEKAAQEKAARSLAAPQTRSEDVRRRLLGVGLLVCTVVFGLGAWTLGAVFRQVVSTGPIADERAPVAVATSCEQLGPVSRFGFGYWWECIADVHSASGKTSTDQEFHGSELTPADIGKPVHVTGESTGSGQSESIWVRNTTRPIAFMQFVVVIVAFIPFLYLLAHGLMRVLPFWLDLTLDKDRYRKYYVKYVREGRLSPQAALDLKPPKKEEDEPPPPPPPGVPVDPPPPAPYQVGPGQSPPANFDNSSGRRR